jgi:NO-binding membrane sensor protein with MHYT domain
VLQETFDMNPPVIGAAVEFRYDLLLVAMSFLTSVFGSYVALGLASAQDKGQDRSLAAAIALGGCGVWAMHFIGMTAYKTPLYVSYAIWPTVLSLLIAVAITWAGFSIALRGTGRMANLVAGGFVIGGGVVAMHYLGMFGLDLRAVFEWNWLIVAGSVLIAVVAATVALWLVFNTKTATQRAVAALVMGVAVCAMHYTAMAAATMICTAQANQSAASLDGPYLPYVVFVLALICLGASVAYVWIGESLTPGGARAKSSAA